METDQPHRVTLVGPTHPYTGGISQHTTRLAQELEAGGHEVIVESWKAQYPKALYPGPDRVPGDKPEIGIPAHVVEKLAWFSPISWWLAGQRARARDIVAFSIPTPFHAIPYLVMLLAIGRRCQRVGIVHNVLPHEPRPLDSVLMKRLLRSFDWIIVHGFQATETALSLGVDPRRIIEQSLPSPWPTNPGDGQEKRPVAMRGPRIRALFFGTIRRYKGLDILLDALSEVPGMDLLVAGEFWEDVEPYQQHIERLGLESRVTLRSGYVAEADFHDIFSQSDLLVLPYRSGTGSIVRELGFRFGLPVIATDVGSIAEGIEDDVTGRIVEHDSVAALAEALTQATTPGVLEAWSLGVAKKQQRHENLWRDYTQALLTPPRDQAGGPER